MTDKDKQGWNFENTYVRLPETFYRQVSPTKVAAPSFSIFNEKLAEELGLDVERLRTDEGLQVFAGNRIPEGAQPIAQAYAGHQFGHFTMLGDGRAILLGEQITANGDRFDIQLKGSGKTPFSRGGDGRAALGPMLREYIISEAMHALGIPTTRSLAVVKTGEPVHRETVLRGAILTRVAKSHIRVGTFQYVTNWCSLEELKLLADYTIKRHYPHIDDVSEERYLLFFQEVLKRQARLIAKWQLVGFIHGVMNTDNMTVSGETIDYGPCAFMDQYDPKTVFSSIDTYGRYAYGNHPPIALWNLARFAETLLPLFHEDEKMAIQIAEELLSQFTPLFQANWLKGMREKLGIFNEEAEDSTLIQELFNVMEKYKPDYTNTFRSLTLGQHGAEDMFLSDDFARWKKKWEERKSRQNQSEEESKSLMRRSNPSVIPRNHRVEEALEAAVVNDDLTVMNNLLNVLSKPYSYTLEQEEYCSLPPKSNMPYRTFCGT